LLKEIRDLYCDRGCSHPVELACPQKLQLLYGFKRWASPSQASSYLRSKRLLTVSFFFYHTTILQTLNILPSKYSSPTISFILDRYLFEIKYKYQKMMHHQNTLHGKYNNTYQNIIKNSYCSTRKSHWIKKKLTNKASAILNIYIFRFKYELNNSYKKT
jgi:hypothetical protein